MSSEIASKTRSGRGSSSLDAISFEAAGELSLPALLARRVDETPERRAVLGVRRALTFSEWQSGAARFARVLADTLGNLRGDRILVWLSNDEAHSFVCVLHGIFMLAGIAVALDDRITATEALSLVHDTDPRALVIGPSVMHNLGERGLLELGADHVAPSDDPERLALVPIRGHDLEHTRVDWSLEDAGDEILGSDARPADHAVIFYSSGSTGKPKGALWRQSDWALYSERTAHAIYAIPRDGKPLGPDDVVQSPIPVYTGAGLMENIYTPVVAGCTLAFESRRFDPVRSAQRMSELGTTIYNGAPPHFAMMCDLAEAPEPTALELLISGGSAFTKPLYERMRQQWPRAAIANWYGLMESGTGQTLNCGVDMEREPEAIGRLVWPAEARIVDANLNDVDDGIEGELWLRGPGQIEGYFRNPEQTSRRLHDGWLRTGDNAVRSTDGLYHAAGRGEDRINRGGFKFYPIEVESVLESHSGVRESGVTAVPHPILGDDVVAFVVRTTGHAVTESELRAYCRTRLAPNKVPARIFFEDALPRNAYGKVMRRQLLARYTQLAKREDAAR